MPFHQQTDAAIAAASRTPPALHPRPRNRLHRALLAPQPRTTHRQRIGRRQQIRRHDRLLKERRSVQQRAGPPCIAVRMARQGDDEQLWIAFAQAARQRGAIDVRQLQIRDEQVRGLPCVAGALPQLQRFVPVVGRENGPPRT